MTPNENKSSHLKRPANKSFTCSFEITRLPFLTTYTGRDKRPASDQMWTLFFSDATHVSKEIVRERRASRRV